MYKSSKLKLMVVTVGIITGIIGILHGLTELLNGTKVVGGNSIPALPVDWPNQEFYAKMQGMPVFSLLTDIPYFLVGILAITVSIVLIIWSITVDKIDKKGILIFSILNIGIFCFGAGQGTPIVEGLPAIICAILALIMKEKERSASGKSKLLGLFNFFFWWNIFSWVLFFPISFVLSFYQEIPQALITFMMPSMPIATIGALITGLLYDKSILINEV